MIIEASHHPRLNLCLNFKSRKAWHNVYWVEYVGMEMYIVRYRRTFNQEWKATHEDFQSTRMYFFCKGELTRQILVHRYRPCIVDEPGQLAQDWITCTLLTMNEAPLHGKNGQWIFKCSPRRWAQAVGLYSDWIFTVYCFTVSEAPRSALRRYCTEQRQSRVDHVPCRVSILSTNKVKPDEPHLFREVVSSCKKLLQWRQGLGQ